MTERRLEIKEVSEYFYVKVVEWEDGDHELCINCGPYEAEARLSVSEARRVMEFIRSWLDSLPHQPTGDRQ